MKTLFTILIILLAAQIVYAGCDNLDNDFDDKVSLRIYEQGTNITSTAAGNLDSMAVKVFWDFYEAPETTYYAGLALYLASDSSFVDSTEHIAFTTWSTDTTWIWFDCIENAAITATTEYFVVVKGDSVLSQHGFDVHRDDSDPGEYWYAYTVTGQMRTWPSKYDADTGIADRSIHIQICYTAAGGAGGSLVKLKK